MGPLNKKQFNLVISKSDLAMQKGQTFLLNRVSQSVIIQYLSFCF